MKIFKKIILIIIMTMLFAPAGMSLAEGNLNDASKFLGQAGQKAIGDSTKRPLSDVIGMGISTALSLVGMIFMVLMIYGGYLWMTAKGEEEQVKKAQKIVIESVIGLVIVLSAYAITLLVTTRLGQV